MSGTRAPKGTPEVGSEQYARSKRHADKILSMLAAAGSLGCTNSQLWTVCHAVNSRVSDLRKRGHRITAECEGQGIWRYRLLTSSRTQPDWYVAATGQPRAAVPKPELDYGPLFSSTDGNR